MYSLSSNQHLVLNNDTILHLTPGGARITIHPSKDNTSYNQMRRIPVATINTTARDALLLCTGEYTIISIVNELINKSSELDAKADQILKATMDFFQQMIDYNVLIPCDKPQKTLPSITGSVNFFVPQHMSIELTANCNLCCVYCYRDAGPTQKNCLPGSTLLGILDNLANYGLRSVELTGGEPLLHPEFEKIFSYCVSRFLRVALLSNGTLINQKMAALIGRHREKILVQVDIDGPSPETHDKARGVPGSFKKTQNAVRFLAAVGVKTRVAMNITKDNYDQIENTLLLAKHLGAEWFVLSPVLDLGRGKNLDVNFSTNQVKYIADLSKRLYEEHGSFLSHVNSDIFVEMFKSEGNCGAGHKVAALGPSGKVRPCPLIPEQVLTFGDLTTDTVETVFSNPVVPYTYQLRSPDTSTCSDCINEIYCRYCHMRGIKKMAESQSACNWGQTNNISNWINLDGVKESPASDMQCPQCFQ